MLQYYNQRDTVRRGSLYGFVEAQKEDISPEHVCKIICDHGEMTLNKFINAWST